MALNATRFLHNPWIFTFGLAADLAAFAFTCAACSQVTRVVRLRKLIREPCTPKMPDTRPDTEG